MARAEALIHSLSDQLIGNGHALEQAVANFRWVEVSRLLAANAELLVKMCQTLIELDPQSAEYAMDLMRQYNRSLNKTVAQQPVVATQAAALAPAPAQGAVGLRRASHTTKGVKSNGESGNSAEGSGGSENSEGTGGLPDGQNDRGPAGGD